MSVALKKSLNISEHQISSRISWRDYGKRSSFYYTTIRIIDMYVNHLTHRKHYYLLGGGGWWRWQWQSRGINTPTSSGTCNRPHFIIYRDKITLWNQSIQCFVPHSFALLYWAQCLLLKKVHFFPSPVRLIPRRPCFILIYAQNSLLQLLLESGMIFLFFGDHLSSTDFSRLSSGSWTFLSSLL